MYEYDLDLNSHDGSGCIGIKKLAMLWDCSIFHNEKDNVWYGCIISGRVPVPNVIRGLGCLVA